MSLYILGDREITMFGYLLKKNSRYTKGVLSILYRLLNKKKLGIKPYFRMYGKRAATLILLIIIGILFGFLKFYYTSL